MQESDDVIESEATSIRIGKGDVQLLCANANVFFLIVFFSFRFMIINKLL